MTALFSAPAWKSEIMTIAAFLKMSSMIDTDPIGQRPPVDTSDLSSKNEPSKSQGIIASILYGFDIGEISIVRNDTGEKYPFESIDGGHRKRGILRFINNKFPIHKSVPVVGGLYFSELPADVREMFLNYQLRLVTYSPMSNVEKGATFRKRNFSTSVNHQEMLNSYGRTPVASFVRNTVRIVPRENNETHDLFTYTLSSADAEPRFKFLNFANRRLDHDERVARILYMVWIGERLDACDKPQLEELYNEQISENDMKPLANKVNQCLDFLYAVAVARRRLKNNGLSQSEFTMLMRLWFYFKEKHGNFKLVDADQFYREFDKAMLKFTGRDEKKLIKGTIKDGKDVRLIHEAFRGYLTVHTSKRKMNDTCFWLTEKAGFNPIESESISVVDTKRFFSNAEIAEKLAEQDYKCWVTGEKLTMKQAQGAHIIPHSKGGKTEWNNLVVVSAEHNRKMSDMNAYDYRDMFERKAA
jgi:hypothetical protein